MKLGRWLRVAGLGLCLSSSHSYSSNINNLKEQDNSFIQELKSALQVRPIANVPPDQVPDQAKLIFLSEESPFPACISQGVAKDLLFQDNYGNKKGVENNIIPYQGFHIKRFSDIWVLTSPLQQQSLNRLQRLIVGGGVTDEVLLALNHVEYLTFQPSTTQQEKDWRHAIATNKETEFLEQNPSYKSTLAKKYEDKWMGVQIIRGIPASEYLLSDVLLRNRDLLRNLDPSSVTQVLLSSLVINPDDAGSQKFKIYGNHEEGWRIASLGGYSSLNAPILQIKHGPHTSQHVLGVKNILYFLPELRGVSIPSPIIEQFAMINPDKLLIMWLAYLEGTNKSFAHLKRTFPDTDFNNLLLQAGAPLKFKPGIVKQLTKQLVELKEALNNFSKFNKGGNVTFEQIFEACQPLVKKAYDTLLNKANQDAFQAYQSLLIKKDTQTNTLLEPAILETTLNPRERLKGIKRITDFLQEESYPQGQSETTLLSEACLEILNNWGSDPLGADIFDMIATLWGEELLKIKGSSLKEASWVNPRHLFSLLGDPEASEAAFKFAAALGVNLDERGEGGKTLLEASIERDSDIRIRHLIEAGANYLLPNREGLLPLELAVKGKKLNAFIPLSQYKHKEFNVKAVANFYEEHKKSNTITPQLKIAFNLLQEQSPALKWKLSLVHLFPKEGQGHDPQAQREALYQYLIKENKLSEDDKEDYEREIKRGKLRRAEAILLEAVGKGELSQALEELNLVPQAEYIEGAESGKRVLLPELKAQLWNEQGEFKKVNKHGRRNVGLIDKDGFKIYVKQYPEFPGYEAAISKLAQRLISYGAPFCDLLNINNASYLLSQAVEGENLFDILKQKPQLLAELDPKHLSEMLIFTMITNPEDGKPDNYILSPLPGGKGYQIVGIDNDHALASAVGKEVIEGRQRHLIQVKTILYCLDQMRETLHPDVLTSFLSFDVAQVLRPWLENLVSLNSKYEGLFDNETARGLINQHQSCVNIPFQPNMIMHLYDKMIKLQKFLQKYQGTDKLPTHWAVLKTLEPYLAHRYEKVLKRTDLSVLKRFETIDGPAYGRREGEGSYITTTSAKGFLTSLNMPTDASLINSIRRGSRELLPESALEELREATVRQTALELQTIDQNFIEKFNSLTPGQRQILLKKLDFSKLTQPQQGALLRLLEGDETLTRLVIKNSSELKDGFLRGELRSINHPLVISHLTHLDLQGCTEVTDRVIPHLAQTCQMLKYLDLSRMPKLIEIGNEQAPLSFPQLKRLIVNNNPNLRAIHIRVPNIRQLDANDCSQFRIVKLGEAQKVDLNLKNATNFTEEALDQLLLNLPQDNPFNIEGCSQITNLRRMFPKISFANLFNQYAVPTSEYLKLAEIIEKIIDAEWTEQVIKIHGSHDGSRLENQSYPLYNLSFWSKFIEKIFKTKSHNTKLLIIFGSFTQDNNWETLAHALLSVGTCLQELHITDADLDATGVKYIIDSLKNNKSISKLNLSNNQIDDDILTEMVKLQHLKWEYLMKCVSSDNNVIIVRKGLTDGSREERSFI